MIITNYKVIQPKSIISFKSGITEKISNTIIKNENIQNILKNCSYNAPIYNSIFIFLLAVTLRPFSIMCTHGNKEDRKYSAARSIASGVADLIFTSAIFIPLGKLLEKTKDILLTDKVKSIFTNNRNTVSTYENLITKSTKLLLSPLQVLLMFWLMPKAVNLIFKNKTDEKKYNEDNFISSTKLNKFC